MFNRFRFTVGSFFCLLTCAAALPTLLAAQQLLPTAPIARQNLAPTMMLPSIGLRINLDSRSRHPEGLHFSHPLFTESISPDTKIRADFGKEWSSEGSETEFEIDAEYAFHRSVSIEIGAPYAFLSPDEEESSSGIGNVEVAMKFANFAFEDHGILLGYGLAVGLPTGDADAGIGTDHTWELEPFLNAGISTGKWEVVAWARFGIPINQDDMEEVETEFHYDLAALYHASARLQLLAELNAGTGLSGAEAGEGSRAVGFGFKVAPHEGSSLMVGAGVSVPLGDDERDARLKISVFRHF